LKDTLKSLRKALQGSYIPITAELSTRAPLPIDEILRQASLLASSVDAIQLAESPDSEARIAPLALASLLIQNGIDTVPRISCRDRNRIALQSDLLGLRALGVSSLVLITGNPFTEGIANPAKPVFDMNCQELVATAQASNEEEWGDTAHEFVIGTAATVFPPKPGWTADDLVVLASTGARFLQTQPCFELEILTLYMKALIQAKLTWKFSVIVTLAPLQSSEMARWLIEKNRSILIPQAVMDRLDNAADSEQEGIEICAGLMRGFAKLPGVSGFNLLSLGNPEAVAATIKASGLRP
jgi:methylenetetrahydrofolate reductase (NADPH)